MFGSIFDHARMTVDASIMHYVGRLAVVIPVAVAFGFATGGAFLILYDAFGAVGACAIMTAAFLVISFIVAMVVVAYDRNQRIKLRQSAQQSALVSGLIAATPAAFAGGTRLARTIGLKTPILLGSALLVAALLTKSSDKAELHS